MKKITFLLLVLLVNVYNTAAQCSMIPHAIDARVNESDLVIEAEVIAKTGVWNDAKSMIYTVNTLRVFKVFKGTVSSSTIEVLTKGGIVDDIMDKVSIALELNIGDTGVFTLINNRGNVRSASNSFEVLSSQQGFLRYSKLDGSARDFQSRFGNITNDVYPFLQKESRQSYRELAPLDFKYADGRNATNRMAVVISSFSTSVDGDANGNAGVGEILTINGSGFGTTEGTVFFEDANSGGGLTSGLYTADQLISWTDTQIEIEIPTRAGTGSFAVQEVTNTMNDIQAGLTIGFSHINVGFDADPGSAGNETWETRLVDDNGTGGYTSNYNTEFVATPGAADTYEDLITTWRCNTGVSFIRGDDTTEDNDPTANNSDGINIVRFDNTTELGGTTLAYALSRFAFCFTSATTIEVHVIEIDVVVNDDFNWYYDDTLPVPTGRYDFETVILHELGHGHQLGHVIDPPQVMHFSIGTGSSKRNLSATDLEGGTYVMDKSTSVVLCSQPVMQVAQPTAVCRDFTVTLDANGEAAITTEDLDNGSTADCLTITGFSGSQLTFDCSDIGTQMVTLTVNFSDGSSDTCTSMVTVEGKTATYQAGAWVGGILPDGSAAVTIDDDLDVGAGNVKGCSCEINAGRTLTIGAAGHLETFGDITVNGSLIVEHEGSVVQKDNAAIVTKGGSGVIEVRKTTPTLAPLGFMFMSSPMSAETRDGVYGGAFRVIDIVSSNFVVDPALVTTDPMDPYFGAEIFLGPDNSFLNNYVATEALVPGDGLVVYPQTSITDGGTSYDMTYTEGVLNNGTINYTVQYNGLDENNFNLIGNPYPSAIDAVEFINANNMINEIYYWEHLTDPASTIPGYLGNNYSMNDISIRNLAGGMAATNGGAVPGQFISSGQGIGIKAVQGGDAAVVFNNGMRVTGNNDQYRNPEQENRIWINVANEEYSLKSQALLAFLPETTEAIDPGYDSRRIASAVSVFTSLKSGEQLGIQSREVFDSSMVIPVGFATAIEEQLTYTISIENVEGNLLETTPVFLVDKANGTFVNLKERSYSFVSNRTLSANRFEVVFETPDILAIASNNLDVAVSLYPNPVNGQLNLQYSGIQDLVNMTIVDVNGRLVFSETFEDFRDLKTFDLSTLTTGIYFVSIQGSETATVKKLIVK